MKYSERKILHCILPLRSLVGQNRQMQIKGEQSLAYPSDSVKFIIDKFDECEQKREVKK